ncbi:MAG: substrate-binding periplasmic protein [Rickettsiales bacterium]
MAVDITPAGCNDRTIPIIYHVDFMLKIAAFSLALLLSIATPAAHAKTVFLVADVWCPYNCAVEAEQPGFLVEIAKKALEKHDINVDYSTLSWDKSIKLARKGEYTALAGASTNDAQDFIFPNVEQGWMSMQFYTKADSEWNYVGKKSLANVSLGVVKAYAYGPTVDNYIQYNANNPSLVQAASGNNALAKNLKKLLNGKVDVIIEDSNVMAYYLKTHNMQDKVRVAGRLPVSDQNNLYIAFSPKEKYAKRYASIVGKEMEAMRRNGELQKILARYGVKDWRR